MIKVWFMKLDCMKENLFGVPYYSNILLYRSKVEKPGVE